MSRVTRFAIHFLVSSGYEWARARLPFFSDEVGLIIFKIKDWVLDQFREANS